MPRTIILKRQPAWSAGTVGDSGFDHSESLQIKKVYRESNACRSRYSDPHRISFVLGAVPSNHFGPPEPSLHTLSATVTVVASDATAYRWHAAGRPRRSDEFSFATAQAGSYRCVVIELLRKRHVRNGRSGPSPSTVLLKNPASRTAARGRTYRFVSTAKNTSATQWT